MKKKQKLLIAVWVILAIIFSIYFYISMSNFYESTVLSNLNKTEKEMLSKEFKVEYITDKINKASYAPDSLIIQIGPFDSIYEEVKSIKFSNNKSSKMIIDNLLNNNTNQQKNIDGIDVITTNINEMKANANFLYSYELDGKYYIELTRLHISNDEVILIFK